MPWTIFETPIGSCGIAWSDAGIMRLQLPEASLAATRTTLLDKTPDAGPRARQAPPWVRDAIARVREHLGGKPQDLSRVPLDLGRVTPFAAKVYRALQGVPAGSTLSYGDLANKIGTPGASRAVGRAMATNPFPILVACHRVLASSGGAGGFSAYGGLVTKEKILQLEGGTLASLARTAEIRQASLFDGARAVPFDGAAALAHLGAADAVLGRHIARVGDLRLALKETEGTFAALCESIVYQQLNGKAAATIFGRVRALYPGGRLDPKRVLATTDAMLRDAGLSRGKLASVRDLAERTAKGEIPTLSELERMDDEAIVERLTKVRGIGRWTVEMLLIFRLGRPDVLPVDDYGIKKGFARVFARGRAARGGGSEGGDALPPAADILRRGERWRPFRSVASWYLWRATDNPEVTRASERPRAKRTASR